MAFDDNHRTNHLSLWSSNCRAAIKTEPIDEPEDPDPDPSDGSPNDFTGGNNTAGLNNLEMPGGSSVGGSQFSVTTCTICRKQFRTCEMYMAHIDRWHIAGEFRCQSSGCGYVATYRIELARHSKREHYNASAAATRRKSHHCTWPDCPKSFTSVTLLKNHLRVHLKYKRFRCKWPSCSYASEQDSNVIRHIRIRHFKVGGEIGGD